MRFCLAIIFLFLVRAGYTQISIGFNTGYHIGVARIDEYRLDRIGPASAQSSKKFEFFDEETTGFTKSINLTWEATKHLGIFIDLSSISYRLPSSKRTANSTHFGAGIKVNFISHEKPVVPFMQLQYMFINTSKLKQEDAYTVTGAYRQPQIEETFKTSLGVGVDAGVEFKLGTAVNIIPSFGFRLAAGTNTAQSKEFLNDHMWTTTSPDGIMQPDWFETEINHFHFRIGLKYYFSKRKKKRDF